MIISIKPWLEIAEQYHHGVTDIPLNTPRAKDMNLLPLAGHAHPGLSGPTGIRGVAEKMDFYHESVLAAEVLHALQPLRGKQIFDGTLGGGGHSEMILENGAHVIGADQDQEALDYATRRLARFGDSFLPVKGNFANMDQLLGELDLGAMDGVLLDLGVSSRQLDRAERGFSFRQDGPLDMRMDADGDVTARDLVNDLDEESLANIFYNYGEEHASRKVAAAVVSARQEKEIETTSQLADVVASVIRKKGKRHPATKVFQALRIAVNRELEVLEAGLEKAIDVLAPGGVLAVITFHSLEDRMVKRFLRHRSTPFINKPEYPEPKPNADFSLRLPTRRAIQPTENEVKSNARARSAKLRVAVKLDG